MAKYFNKTRGTLAITLPDGESVSMGPKDFITIEGGLTESIIQHLRSGSLISVAVPVEEVESAGPLMAIADEASSIKKEEPAKVVSLDSFKSDDLDKSETVDEKNSLVDSGSKSKKK